MHPESFWHQSRLGWGQASYQCRTKRRKMLLLLLLRGGVGVCACASVCVCVYVCVCTCVHGVFTVCVRYACA